jgi:hypothetical protein
MDLEYKYDINSQDKYLNKETDILSNLKKEKDYIYKQYKLKKVSIRLFLPIKISKKKINFTYT